MPGALIAIDQDRPGPITSFGTPGVARNDLWLSNPVNPRSAAMGNTTYAWTLLNAPPGSAATLATPTAITTSFTPDVAGTYRLQLLTNGGGAGNVQILVLGVRYSAAGVLVRRGWRLPAIGEGGTENNFLGQLRGWGEAFEFLLGDLLEVLQGLLGNILSVSATTPITNLDDRIYLSGLVANTPLSMPLSPVLGQRHRFIDTDGSLATWTVPIAGNGANFSNGAATFTLTAAYQVVSFEWTGTVWSIVDNFTP